MKVLVTGAAGFIGSNLVYHLLESRPSWKITALDLLTYAGNIENIAGLINDRRIEFIKCDIADPATVNELFAEKGFDLVFHLAAESHVDRSIHSAAEFIKTNVVGTQVLLDAALSSKVSRFVHISTDEVYGSLGPTGYFYETTLLDPTSPYAASKAASDLIVLAYFKTHGLETVVTRCTNNYGPYQFPEKLIPLFVTNALEDKPLPLYGDGLNVRSWIYVRDHCEALLCAAEKGVAGEVYNIGGTSDGEVNNRVVTAAILEILKKPETLIKPVKDRPAHDRRYAVDSSKINGIGWKAGILFREGLEKTIKWYVDNRSWWQSIKTGAYLEYYERNYGAR
ncbi:MAG: dTDP-glucose 4,6-dehydratase [Deltaproteobacteria bacterium]|nr:dTDP-glucose 4,6-dehydratase [Deltaproteobacteria bacterium]